MCVARTDGLATEALRKEKVETKSRKQASRFCGLAGPGPRPKTQVQKPNLAHPPRYREL